MRRGVRPHHLQLARFARRFRRDEDGNVIVYVTIAAAAILGMAGLALDGSRALTTHSEAQAAADAAALAAASQLDGGSDALIRATNAAQTAPLVVNTQKFAQGASSGPAVTITGVRFLKNLPPVDRTAIDSSYETTDPSQARFVEVTTEQLTHSNSFLRAVSDSVGVNIHAVAVAGFKEMYCKVPPLMICNPDEVMPGDPFDAEAHIGAEIRAKTQGTSTAQWAPGTFGLLDQPDCGNSASCMRTKIAALDPNQCVKDTIDVRPGQAEGPTSDGINVRFGFYGVVQQSASTPPDTNITQNYAKDNGQGCYKNPPIAGAGFPDDTDNPPNKTFGDGLWNCSTYWTANHTQPMPSWCTSSTGAPYTRYSVYQAERDAASASKYGQSQCNTAGVDDRRVLYLTVVNCKANSVKSNSTNVPVLAMMKTFLLRPVSQSGGSDEIDLEVIDVVRPGVDNAVLKDDVQLYR